MTPNTQSVCKHCQKEISVRTFGWQYKGQYLCLHNFNGGKHEPMSEPASTGEPVPQVDCAKDFGGYPMGTYKGHFYPSPQPVSGDAPEPFDIRDGKHRYSPCIRCGARLGMGLSCDSAGVFVRCTACSFTGPNAKSDKEAFELWNSLANADPAPSPTPSVSTRQSAREWMKQTGEFGTELYSSCGKEMYDEILAAMDEFGEYVESSAAPSVAGTQPTCPTCNRSDRVEPSTQRANEYFCKWCGKYFPGAAQGTPQVEEIAQQFVHIVFPSMDAQCARRYIQEGAKLLRQHGVGAPAQPGPEEEK